LNKEIEECKTTASITRREWMIKCMRNQIRK
jgi:hypothetical protein